MTDVHPILRPRYDRVAARPKTRRALKALVAEAEAVHAPYPQYVGHWTGWERVVVTQDVRTKMGLAFRAGDIALAKPLGTDIGWLWPNGYSRMCYSWRNEIDTAVPAFAVRPYTP